MNIPLVNRFLDDTPFILESRMELILQAGFSDKLAEHPFDKELRKKIEPQMTLNEKTGVGVIPIEGVLAWKPDLFEMLYFGMEDSSKILALIESAAANPKVKAILLDVNSPGGFSIGGFEMADAVAEAGKYKPTMTHIGGVGASLAYLVGSQANEVMANRGAMIGSIGAYNVNIDRTRMIENFGIKVEVFKNKEAKFKAIGQPGTSLTGEQREYLSAKAQQSFDDFKDAVLSKRPKVSADAMQGQVFTGRQALANGLVDSVGTFGAAMLKLCEKCKRS